MSTDLAPPISRPHLRLWHFHCIDEVGRWCVRATKTEVICLSKAAVGQKQMRAYQLPVWESTYNDVVDLSAKLVRTTCRGSFLDSDLTTTHDISRDQMLRCFAVLRQRKVLRWLSSDVFRSLTEILYLHFAVVGARVWLLDRKSHIILPYPWRRFWDLSAHKFLFYFKKKHTNGGLCGVF